MISVFDIVNLGMSFPCPLRPRVKKIIFPKKNMNQKKIFFLQITKAYKNCILLKKIIYYKKTSNHPILPPPLSNHTIVKNNNNKKNLKQEF